MRLAEALLERKAAQEQLERLEQRFLKAVLVQEGDTAPENADALEAQIRSTLNRLEELTVAINRTNMSARLASDSTLMEAIARRDTLRRLHRILEGAADRAVVTRDRFTRNEIRFVATVDVAGLRRRADLVAKAYPELDAEIQAANWTNDLSE